MNFEKKDTEDLSTEELIRRLMENFKQEDEAEKQKEEAAVSLDFHFNDIDTPAEEAGDDTAEEPSLEEEIENDKENEGEDEESYTFAKDEEDELFFVKEEGPDLPTESKEKTMGGEKFKFRVQKSQVTKAAAIPLVSDALEGSFEEDAEETPKQEPVADMAPESEEVPEMDAEAAEETVVDAPAGDDYAEMEKLAKDALDEEKADEKASEGVFEQAQSDFGQLSEDDVNLMMIFGEQPAEGEEQSAKEKESKPQIKHKKEDEYDDPAKAETFFAGYRRKYGWMKLRLALAALVFLLCGVIECVTFFGVDLPGMLSAKNYPEIHLLIAVQLTLFCALVALPEIILSVRSALRGCPGPGILLTLGASFNLVYEILLAISKNHVGTPTFNWPLALCSLMAVLGSWMQLRNEMMAFDIVSSAGVKFTATRQKDAESEMEKDAFDQYLDETPRIFGVQKTDFVTDFVANENKYAKKKSICGVIATLSVIVAVVFLILGYYRTGTLLDGLGYCQLALMFCLPVCSFMVFGLPVYRAGRKAFAMDCAIVGDASVDEYADASVVSFNDSDVFPAAGVKVRSIKLYGNSRIDKVLYTVSGLFDQLGGPLAEVFRHATKDFGVCGEVDLLETKPGGVEAVVDGTHIYCGNGAYINSRGFVPAYDPSDVAIEREGKLSIMFVVIGKELAAKMYIEYRMDPEMKEIVSALYKAGMCMGIRTLDPNIDDSMLGRRIRLTEYPVRVLKCKNKQQLSGVAEKAKSGVVSRKSAKNLLKTLSLCDRAQLLTRIGVAVKILSVLAGIAAASLVYAFGSFLEITSVHVLLYQLFWMIPATAFSMFFI